MLTRVSQPDFVPVEPNRIVVPVQTDCLILTVTKPYVLDSPGSLEDLGVPGKITGSVESGDLPEIITAVGPYKTAHIVGCLHHGELLEGTMNFALLPEYFGGSFDREQD